MIDLSVTICYCKFTEYQFWQTDQILIQIKKFLGVSPLISLDEKVIELKKYCLIGKSNTERKTY